MKLNALLMCRQLDSLRILVAALDEVEVEQEACVNAVEAMELLAQGFYSALVVDFDLPSAATVARMARLAPAQRRPVVFALINPHTDIGNAYQSGANFVLYKPLQAEQVARSLRAGYAFMQSDRRRSHREKIDSLVYLRFGDVCPLPALVLDVSEDGLSVQTAEPLPAIEVPIRFILPGTAHMIDGSGEVMWADETGRAGILFGDLTAASRRQLKDWIRRKARSRARSRRSVSSGDVQARAAVARMS
jgi:CheY-like chemotaxis protein